MQQGMSRQAETEIKRRLSDMLLAYSLLLGMDAESRTAEERAHREESLLMLQGLNEKLKQKYDVLYDEALKTAQAMCEGKSFDELFEVMEDKMRAAEGREEAW